MRIIAILGYSRRFYLMYVRKAMDVRIASGLLVPLVRRGSTGRLRMAIDLILGVNDVGEVLITGCCIFLAGCSMYRLTRLD